MRLTLQEALERDGCTLDEIAEAVLYGDENAAAVCDHQCEVDQASFCRTRNEEKSFASAMPTGTTRQPTRASSRGSACRTASAKSMTVARSNNVREIPRWNRRSSDSSQESRLVSKRRPSLESVQLFLSEHALHASAGAR